MRVLKKSHTLRTNFRQLLQRFIHVPYSKPFPIPRLASPVLPIHAFLARSPRAALFWAPRPFLSYAVGAIISGPVPSMAPSQCWKKPLLQSCFWPNFLLLLLTGIPGWIFHFSAALLPKSELFIDIFLDKVRRHHLDLMSARVLQFDTFHPAKNTENLCCSLIPCWLRKPLEHDWSVLNSFFVEEKHDMT